MILPCHHSTRTTSLPISTFTIIPTPLLPPSPHACNILYPSDIFRALNPFHFVYCTHSTSIFRLFIMSTNFNAFPFIVPTLRLPIRTSHKGRCRVDAIPCPRTFLAAAGRCGASVTPDAVSLSRFKIAAIIKKLANITIDKDNNEGNKAAYKTAKKEAKKSVSIAKARAYDRLYADMDTTEGQKKVLRMAKERETNSKDIILSVKGDQR